MTKVNEMMNNNNNGEGKEDVKMNNNINEKVNNNMKGGVNMKSFEKMGIKFGMFANGTQERGLVPQIVITVNGSIEPATNVTFANFGLIQSAMKSGEFSRLHRSAKDMMFFRYTVNSNVFTLNLTSERPEKKEEAPIQVALPSAPIEEIQKEFAAAMEAESKLEAHLKDVMDKDITEELGLEGCGLEIEDVIELAQPNPYILEENKELSKVALEKREILAAKAPRTGVETVEQYTDLVYNKIVIPAVTDPSSLKIQTAHMNFFKIKEFNATGTGRDYKRVALPFIFKLFDINNFVILSHVPNKSNLAFLMENGFVANVQVGWEIKGYDEEGKENKVPIMEEKLFKYLATSASKQRQERYIFTAYEDRETIRKMLVFWSSDFDFGKNTAIAKAESRVGQNLSTGICIGGAVPYAKRKEYKHSKYGRYTEFYYMVIEDMTVAEFKKLRGETPEPGDEKKVLGDGSGFHTEAAGRKAKKRLRNRNAMILQHRLGKGTTWEASNEFVAKFAEIRGLDIDVNQPIIFVSKSMWKFNPGMELLPFTVLRSSEEMSDYAAMCYETWNALDISGPNGFKTLETLAKRQFKMFYMDTTTDAGLIMHRLGTVAKTKSGLTTEDLDNAEDNNEDLMQDKTLATSLFRYFAANPFYARRSEYLMAQVRMLFSRKIADMARGKILVDGSFCIMMIDPGVWTGKTHLKKGQVYVAGRTGKCLLARYPMVYQGEPQVKEAVDVPEFAKYKGLNIVIMNAYDFAWEKMQGADFDGDACLVTFEQSVIDLAVSDKVPEAPDMPKKEATKAVLNWESIADYFLTNFAIMHPEDPTYVPTIGKTNNIVAALLSAAHTNGTFNSEETIKRVQHLAVTINDLIDAAKTGVMPSLEKFFFDTYKILPNWLAKGFKAKRNSFVNTWEVVTVENDPESLYFMDTKSPLGKLCNGVIPTLYKNFIVKGDKPFKVDDFVGMYDSNISHAVQMQIDGIRKEYIARSRAIFSEESEICEEQRSDEYKALCENTNLRIKKVAKAFNNDIYTVAIACLLSGGAAGFAFKCFEEGVIAVFEKMEGVTLYKLSDVKELPENPVIVKYDNVQYLARKRASKEVQFNNFVAADIANEVTLRIVGLQYYEIQSMNDLKAKIAAANNIITGSKASNGYYVAMANGKAIGKVYLDEDFAATSAFVQGGTAEVLSVNFVRSKAEQSMTYQAFMASKNLDAKITYADLTVRYTCPVDGGDKTPSSSDESTMGIAEPSFGPQSGDYSPVGSIDEELLMPDMSIVSAGLSGMLGLEPVAPKEQTPAPSNELPDANFESLFETCPDFACEVEPDHSLMNDMPINYQEAISKIAQKTADNNKNGLPGAVQNAMRNPRCYDCPIVCDGTNCSINR